MNTLAMRNSQPIVKFSKNSASNRFKIPSSFYQHPGTYPPEIDELNILLKQGLRKLRIKTKDNLSKTDRMAIDELKNNSNLVIKPADKGSAVLVLSREDYIKEANRQLNESSYYRKLSADPTSSSKHDGGETVRGLDVRKKADRQKNKENSLPEIQK